MLRGEVTDMHRFFAPLAPLALLGVLACGAPAPIGATSDTTSGSAGTGGAGAGSGGAGGAAPWTGSGGHGSGPRHHFQYGGTLDDSEMTIALDGQGRFVLAGNSASPTIDFGTGPLPQGAGTLFVAVIAGDGTPAVARRYDAPVGAVTDVEIAADGDILLTGTYGTPMTLGDALTPIGHSDGFVARLAPDGTPRWARTIGVADVYTSGGRVVEDAHGDLVAVAGGYGPLLVTKLDAHGQTVFAAHVGNVASDTLYAPVQAMVVDAHGDLLITGAGSGSFPIAGKGAAGVSGAFAAKLSGVDGSAIWATTVEGGDLEVIEGESVVVDASGDAFVSGTSFYLPYLARLSGADGSVVWSVPPASDNTMSAKLGLAPDGALEVLVSLTSDATIGGATAHAGSTLAAFNPDTGAFLHATRVDELGTMIARTQNGFAGLGAMVVGKDGTVVVESSFFDPVTTDEGTFTSQGWGDVFVVVIDP
jgi:hypothetical protein